MVMLEPTTSPSLLLRIRNQSDSHAWQTFEEIYAPVVRSFCRRRGIQEADVDDLVQEIMIRVAKAIRQFDYDPKRGRFRSWFGRITNNRVKSFLRARATQLTGRSDDIVFDRIADPDSLSDWNVAFCQKVLTVACDRIRPRFEAQTWASFELTWLKQLSAAEAADRLNLPIHTIYVNKSRVLKQLEAEVRALSDEFPVYEQDDHESH